MPDTKQYKSVAVDLSTHKKLVKLATEDHRKVSQQITKLVFDAYKERYPNEVNAGIGSAA